MYKIEKLSRMLEAISVHVDHDVEMEFSNGAIIISCTSEEIGDIERFYGHEFKLLGCEFLRNCIRIQYCNL